MHFRAMILSMIAITTLVSADQKPISQAIVEQLGVFGSEIAITKIDDNTISVFTPISYHEMVGGKKYGDSFGHSIQNVIERNCLAYGGNVYFYKKDKFGDNVSFPSFDPKIIEVMTSEEKMKYVEINPSKSMGDNYIISWFDMRKKLFTDERLQRTFMFDTDYLRPESGFYQATCKDQKTDELLWSAISKKVKDTDNSDAYNIEYLNITFNSAITAFPPKHQTTSKTLEEIYSDYIEDRTAGKLLLRYDIRTILSTNYAEIAKEYCDSLGGSTIVDQNILQAGEHIHAGSENKVACSNVEHPFTLTFYHLHYIVSKDTPPNWLDASNAKSVPYNSSDPKKDLAIMTSKMPLGATSESNIGNSRLVATVYGSSGSNIFVNIQEANNISSLRNFQVSNGNATDITDPNWTFGSISRLPKKMNDAKHALVNQCSAYGMSQLSVDNYTAVCIRQGAGSNCLANMIYTRGNQFAGKESFGCNK